MKHTLSAITVILALATAFVACDEGAEVYSGEPSGTIAFVSTRDGGFEIYVMDAGGTGQTNITNNAGVDENPSWSPDGERLAFSSGRPFGVDIYTMNPDGSDPQQITDHPAAEGYPRWSPDGDRIAFYAFRSQTGYFLWTMAKDGSDLQEIAIEAKKLDPPCAGGFPGSWASDGQHIIFRGSEGSLSALQICSVATDGTDLKVLLSEVGTANEFPALSPDGKKIAFTSDRDGNGEIYVMNAGGGGLHRLTNDPATDQFPAWSPDGQWIAFHSDRDGNYDIYIMRPDGSDVRRLTEDAGDDTQPAWRPD